MKVCFGLATYDRNVCVDFLESMMRTIPHLVERQMEVTMCVIAGQCFIDQARNDIAAHFLNKTDADSLFFIDSDQGWDPLAVVRLLEHPAEVVGGVVPKRTDQPDFNIGGITGVIENDWIEVAVVGTGFLRIKRSAFEKLEAAYPEYKDVKTISGSLPYFQSGFYNPDPKATRKEYTGEDVFFCHQWRRIGGRCWIYPDIHFTHRGQKAWKGNFHRYALENELYSVKEPETCQVEAQSA